MHGPSYPAARTVAQQIAQQFGATAPQADGGAAAALPDSSAIEEIISAAFWASLLREEGQAPEISLAYLDPLLCPAPLTFGKWLPLTPQALAHLAPAVKRPGIHLGVWWQDGELRVWGTTRSLPLGCLVLEVVRPGLVVVKYRRSEQSAKLANLALLDGPQVRFLEQHDAIIDESPLALSRLLGFCAAAGVCRSDDLLVRLAVSMRAHGRGGSLLLVPQQSTRWQDSVVQPFSYAVDPPHSELGRLLQSEPTAAEQLRGAVEALAGLTAVDGATLISDHFELLAFGVKLRPRSEAGRIGRLLLTDPYLDSPEREAEAAQLGGTRHLSVAQFVHDQPDSVGIVASQDGGCTVFAWAQEQGQVRAHRLEALLM